MLARTEGYLARSSQTTEVQQLAVKQHQPNKFLKSLIYGQTCYTGINRANYFNCQHQSASNGQQQKRCNIGRSAIT